jgi:hypothetical protein
MPTIRQLFYITKFFGAVGAVFLALYWVLKATDAYVEVRHKTNDPPAQQNAGAKQKPPTTTGSLPEKRTPRPAPPTPPSATIFDPPPKSFFEDPLDWLRRHIDQPTTPVAN